MRFRDHYDWIVLGNHPAALLSANLVAKLGLSVLVLPMGNHMAKIASNSGQLLDPEPNYFLGLGKTEQAEGLTYFSLRHIGISSGELDQFIKTTLTSQVLTQQSRIAFGSPDTLEFELQRELGKKLTQSLHLHEAVKLSQKEILEYWNGLPKRLSIHENAKASARVSFSLRNSLNQLSKSLKLKQSQFVDQWNSFSKNGSYLSRTFQRPDLIDTFNGMHFWMTSQIAKNPSLFDLLHLLSISSSGGSFKGGLTSLRAFLLASALKLGVHIPQKIECKRVFIERGSFAGVQISSKSNMISAHGAIVGCSTQSVYSKCNYTGRNWFQRQKASPLPVGWRFTIALTVQKEALLKGMETRLVWQEENAPPLEIEISDQTPETNSKFQHQTLFLRTLMPFTVESLQLEYQKLIAARMLRQVMEIMPFIEFHVVKIFPDFRSAKESQIELQNAEWGTESHPNELTMIYGFSSLDTVPENLLVYSGAGMGSKTGIEGLFVASNESFPQLGSFGSIIAAFDGVTWLARESHLKGPFG